MNNINIGLVYFDRTDKEIQEDITKNRMVTEGVALIDLLDLINLLEIHNADKPHLTLQMIKHDIMKGLGKIKDDETENKDIKK